MVEGRRVYPYPVNLTPPLSAQRLSVNNYGRTQNVSLGGLVSLKLTLSCDASRQAPQSSSSKLPLRLETAPPTLKSFATYAS